MEGTGRCGGSRGAAKTAAGAMGEVLRDVAGDVDSYT